MRAKSLVSGLGLYSEGNLIWPYNALLIWTKLKISQKSVTKTQTNNQRTNRQTETCKDTNKQSKSNKHSVAVFNNGVEMATTMIIVINRRPQTLLMKNIQGWMRDLADSNFSETVRSDPLLLPPTVDEHLPGGFYNIYITWCWRWSIKMIKSLGVELRIVINFQLLAKRLEFNTIEQVQIKLAMYWYFKYNND